MATIPASENEFPEVLFAEGAAPAAPGTGLVKAYAKADGLLYFKDDAGTEYPVSQAADLAAHLADASDAHDASAVSVLDTAAVFTATDVEAALKELYDAIGAGGIPATIFDAQGDLIVASAADTAARLALGAANTVLQSNGTTAAWAVPRLSVTLGPWYIADLPGSATTQAALMVMNTTTAVSQTGAGASRIKMQVAGRVVGAILQSDAARTAGTATLWVKVNTTDTAFNGSAVVLDATDTLSDSSFVAYASGVAFSAGDTLAPVIITSGWTPTTANVDVWLIVQIDV